VYSLHVYVKERIISFSPSEVQLHCYYLTFQYNGDSNKGTPNHVAFTDDKVANCGTNYMFFEDNCSAIVAAAHEVMNTKPMPEQDNNSTSCSSEDDIILEDLSSDEEEDKETKSPNTVVTTVAETMDERAAANSEQVVGPSCLVENKNSFNIISRTSTYNTSSSDSDEDAWDESLFAHSRPGPSVNNGLFIKADIEKDVQKRKALHAKFNQFMSTPLPMSNAHGGVRGKRGGRRAGRGSQRAGHRASSGRGFNPAFTSVPGRGGTLQLGRGNPPMLPFPSQPLSQPQSSPQQFSQQTFQQQPLPHQSFQQQSLPQQSFPQQSPQQPFPRPQQLFLQQNYSQQNFPQQPPPRQQYPKQRSPQKQFTQQQPVLHQPSPPDHFVQHSPPQSSSLQRLPQQQHTQPQYQSQPWQPPKLKSMFGPVKETSSSAVTDLSQLDEKGMKNEYEWQRWMIERAVKRAFEGLSEDTVSNFTNQLQKILNG